MNELERYLFDLQGFLIVESALTSTEIDALNQQISRQIATTDEQLPCLRFDSLLSWGTAFRSLIDNPKVTPYLKELLGSNFRLDHDYLHIIRRGKGPIGANLHGGGTPYDPCQYYTYKDGRMYNGLLAVAYNLTDVQKHEGGFGCVPGSHKSNLPFPNEWRDLEQPHACVQAVTGKAGTAIIFTEALAHGTLPWQGSRERRTLFYKYSPHPSAWSRDYYQLADFPELNEAQRSILKTPGVYP